MIPAIPEAPFIADQNRLRVEAALHPVERGHRLAVLGGRHGQRPVRDPVEVEGVQGLGCQKHDVVGDVDDVVDRALARRRQA